MIAKQAIVVLVNNDVIGVYLVPEKEIDGKVMGELRKDVQARTAHLNEGVRDREKIHIRIQQVQVLTKADLEEVAIDIAGQLL